MAMSREEMNAIRNGLDIEEESIANSNDWTYVVRYPGIGASVRQSSGSQTIEPDQYVYYEATGEPIVEPTSQSVEPLGSVSEESLQEMWRRQNIDIAQAIDRQNTEANRATGLGIQLREGSGVRGARARPIIMDDVEVDEPVRESLEIRAARSMDRMADLFSEMNNSGITVSAEMWEIYFKSMSTIMEKINHQEEKIPFSKRKMPLT